MQRKVAKHMTTEELVDFVNQQHSKEEMQRIQTHLQTGCRTCSELLEVWERVRRAARRELEYDAPQSAVRQVQSAFAVMAESSQKHSHFEVPRLVFDSLWQPAFSGTRSRSRLPRQVLYRLGEIAMEMRLEPELDSERMNITGQISLGKQEQEEEGLAGIPVILGNARGVVAETSTNQFGEFQLTYLPERDVRICFGTIKGRNVSVPLDAEN